jgi:YVTN family beta-propeller protein
MQSGARANLAEEEGTAVFVRILILLAVLASGSGEAPGPTEAGYLLPNGWRITPVGKQIPTQDLLLNIAPSPDGRVMVATHGGYNPHGLVVIDAESDRAVQRIPLPTAWFGLAWAPDGSRLYVSGGNNEDEAAPIYVFSFADGRLSEAPVATFTDHLPAEKVYWSGLAHHPSKPVVYAANRNANQVVAIDSASGKVTARVDTEVNPYDLVVSRDGTRLYCSNWASDSVSVIDTESFDIVRTIRVGDNPNDMVLTGDGRLFVCCSNDNTVVVIDTGRGRAVETIVTSLYPNAPEGSTPNALALSPDRNTLYVANADNYNVCVVDVEEAGEYTVLGFIPSGWYPAAVAASSDGRKLYIGNAKGVVSAATVEGPHSPLLPPDEAPDTAKTTVKGTVSVVDIPRRRGKLRALTRQAYANCPYSDELLARARPPVTGPSIVPPEVGVPSPIRHVIYIIKENRTYDQVLGDLPQGNGDPRLCIFGREITPNHHTIAEQYVLFDNLYCDAEVSWDGHQWSNAAYATDYVEKTWPALYADRGRPDPTYTPALLPSAGYIWDQCFRKGLTYRSYGEFAQRQDEDEEMTAMVGMGGLHGHVAPRYLGWGARDVENAAQFIREFDLYEQRFDSDDPEERLPSFIVMSLPEDHTRGTRPGEPTPRAAVASNDYALGMIIDRVSHSRYWPEMAVFVIEDDAQDGSDHVDARRTVGFVVSPYSRRGTVDSTFYTTSSMLRTIELLLGLQPMSQYDAAATPMYAALGTEPDMTPYDHLKPNVDLDEKNQETAWGAQQSLDMDLSSFDRTPMFALNEIVWKAMRGPESEMPLPVHRFNSASLRDSR